MNKFAALLMTLLAFPAMASLDEGLSYFDSQQFSQAFAELKPLADQGNDVAQYYVAYLYLNGYGVAFDENLGKMYLDRSADQSFEKALSLKAYLMTEGRYYPQDKEGAIRLYEQAAQKGDNDANMNLGIAYLIGDGVKQDSEQAMIHFKKVNLTEKPIAGRYIGDLYMATQEEADRQEALKYYELAASNGDIPSFFAIGYASKLNGDIPKALEYYRYAAAEGHAQSQYMLGTMYANGEGVPRNNMTAYAWLFLAANQGLAHATQAQRQLEGIMTLSELEQARREVIKIQNTILKQVEPPLKNEKKELDIRDITPVEATSQRGEGLLDRTLSRRRPRNVGRSRR